MWGSWTAKVFDVACLSAIGSHLFLRSGCGGDDDFLSDHDFTCFQTFVSFHFQCRLDEAGLSDKNLLLLFVRLLFVCVADWLRVWALAGFSIWGTIHSGSGGMWG